MLEEYIKYCENAKTDYLKFLTGNKAAGIRLRKWINEMRKMAPEARREIWEQIGG